MIALRVLTFSLNVSGMEINNALECIWMQQQPQPHPAAAHAPARARLHVRSFPLPAPSSAVQSMVQHNTSDRLSVSARGRSCSRSVQHGDRGRTSTASLLVFQDGSPAPSACARQAGNAELETHCVVVAHVLD